MKKLLRVLGRLFLALLFLAAAALVTLGLLRWRGLILLPDEADPDEWEVFGVDVSSYQGEVDWPVLAEQGVDFAFIKATEGSLLQDRRFAANWAGSAAAGERAGAYLFLSYDSPGETQAVNFIAAVPVTEGALPPVVDIEFYGEYLDTPPEKERVRAILDPLLERLEELDAQSLLDRMAQMEQEGTTFMNKQKQDTRRRRFVAPIVVAIVMSVLMAGLIWLFLWAFEVDPAGAPPLPVLALFVAIPAAVVVGVVIALVQRVREIERGEEDDARNY